MKSYMPMNARFIRFCAVGAANTLIDFGVFSLLFYGAGAPILAAHAPGFLVATGNSYILNKHWTFKHREPAKVPEIFRFLVVAVSALAVTSLVVYEAAQFVPPLVAKAAAVAVSLVWNYWGMKFAVFRKTLGPR